MAIRKTLFLLIACLGLPAAAFTQNQLAIKWQDHIAYVKQHYPELPKQKLDSITAYLDSTAIAEHCYQFITNNDKTKFIAFYLVDRSSASFTAIKREYGGTYRSFTWGGKKEDQVEAFAYTVNGIYYQEQWYYDIPEYLEFYASTKQEAQNIFLIRTLIEGHFFFGKTPKENKRFWEKNSFEKNTYPYKEKYPNTPEVVISASLSKNTREAHNKNKALEQLACTVSTAIWDYYHHADSATYARRYLGRYMEDYCLCLYNSDRNIVLLPLIYFNSAEQPYLRYYVLKLSNAGPELYLWKKFPERQIADQEKGGEGRAVIYDIRNFIKNWGWGTVNMISTKEFWKENFTDDDLEIQEAGPNLFLGKSWER